MQRLTSEAVRDMMRQEEAYEDAAIEKASSYVHALHYGADAETVADLKRAYEDAKLAHRVWSNGMRALGVHLVKDTETCETLGAYVDGQEFVSRW